jgi:hypothetical protein
LGTGQANHEALARLTVFQTAPSTKTPVQALVQAKSGMRIWGLAPRFGAGVVACRNNSQLPVSDPARWAWSSVNGGTVAGGILLPVNKNGNPGTLVAAHPSNTNAARYGVYSPRLASPRLVEPRAREIEAELLEAFEFTATQRIAVHEVARCMAILDAIDRDLDERGLVDRGGKSRSILNHRARISRQLDHWLAKISPAIDRQTAHNS